MFNDNYLKYTKAYLILSLSLSWLAGCTGESPPGMDGAAVNQASDSRQEPSRLRAEAVRHLPHTAVADYLLLDDFDQDGLTDIAFTFHAANHAQLFRHLPGREWQAGPNTALGFHPGELLKAPDVNGKKHYLQLAEGEKALRVLSPVADGDFRLVAEIGATYPRAGAWFRWPGWGQGLAFAPYKQAKIILVQDLAVETLTFASQVSLPFTPSFSAVQQVAAVDIDGDEIDEILFADAKLSRVMQISYPGSDGVPSIRNLWSFEEQGAGREVIPADVDQDGDVDLIIPDQRAQVNTGLVAVNILTNMGSAGWEPRTITIRTRDVGGVDQGLQATAAGIDHDDHALILAAAPDRLTLVRLPAGWKGEGEDQALRQINLDSKWGFSSAALMDVDNDGWLDAVLAARIDKAASGQGLVVYGPLWPHFAELIETDLLPTAAPGALALPGDKPAD
jgi:hypothetical protein